MADSTIDRILRMRRMGMNNNQIGAILGISGTQVSQLLKDPTIADPVVGAQTSRSQYMGDITVANPGNDNPVNVGAPLQIVPAHPLMVDVGFYANIDPADPNLAAISTGVKMKLLCTVGGVELSELEDFGDFEANGEGFQAVSSILTYKTCLLQVQAQFIPGAQPEWDIHTVGPDFKLTTQHFNADQSGFVDHTTAVIAHGADAAAVAAALNAVDDLPGVFEVTGGPDVYRVKAPHVYNAMDIVDVNGVYNQNGVGYAIPQVTDQPDSPPNVTFQDVSIFFGSA